MTLRHTTRVLTATVVAALAWCAVASAAAPRTTIEIPTIGLRATVTHDVDAGPGWWPAVGRPGDGTTVAIAGHRTTHSRPFARLGELRRGDLVILRTSRGRFVYAVTGSRVYPASSRHIADLRSHEVLILSTCTPPGSDIFRLVVYALPAKDELHVTSK